MTIYHVGAWEPIMTKHSRLIILGSGPAGLTAAIYAARAMLKPILVEGIQPGGQMTITTDVENYPGFADVVQGPWLMEQMKLQALHVGTEIINDHVIEAKLSTRPFQFTGDSGQHYTSDSLIIATGAQAKWLGLPSEEHFKGFGVSACATCDGFFFKGKKVLVIGGGNTAVEEALFLTNFASEVVVVHRRSEFRAEKILQARLFANKKISVRWDTVLQTVLGTDAPKGVTGARLMNLKSGLIEDISAEGIFIAIGHKPATELFIGQLAFTPSGYIAIKDRSMATTVPGVFAAGDVADEIYRQAVTAAGMGCMAALEAEKYLAHQTQFHAAAE
jgi:thioredoxin reductase (NADPH)